ncbi:hypothetical protein [Rhizobium sp. FKY42]|uniref:hypothetical protein n=1 Tax=Rhizobium sp. FKY42 TaxID=2562310 RepID=UPI0010C08262|nr:hypothetical protein [Rhizobium sp. FKY42]
MAKTPSTPAPTYEPDAEYSVRLARPVPIVPGRTLRPMNDHTLRGDLLTLIVEREGADVIDTAERI